VKRILQDPSPILVRVERWQRETLDALAQHSGHSLNREMQLAVAKHLHTAHDDHVDGDRVDDSGTAIASRAGEAIATNSTRSKEKETDVSEP